ncbi:hypothetical protein VitviT2T_027363 [Vitis vinifera]|uniref:GRPD C-terminal domain-containing protein n=1 Tax=Vitis vinifera TaxID=29760 RepID=A0ABY9DPT7_VITVI|nr:hypothetical protein VitviT2T_027363 [Vitis vinifera]
MLSPRFLKGLWLCLLIVHYTIECEEVYGRILDNKNMLSSVQGISEGKLETFGYDIWNRMYPSEPFELDLSSCSRKLEYETKNCASQKNGRDFMAVVEFSAEDPYGKAVALLNLNNVSSTDINDAPEEEVYGYKNYKDKITNQSTATGREEKTAEEDSKVIPEKDWTWKVGYNNCEAVGKILAVQLRKYDEEWWRWKVGATLDEALARQTALMVVTMNQQMTSTARLPSQWKCRVS